jgi:hypothetical protein
LLAEDYPRANPEFNLKPASRAFALSPPLPARSLKVFA